MKFNPELKTEILHGVNPVPKDETLRFTQGDGRKDQDDQISKGS